VVEVVAAALAGEKGVMMTKTTMTSMASLCLLNVRSPLLKRRALGVDAIPRQPTEQRAKYSKRTTTTTTAVVVGVMGLSLRKTPEKEKKGRKGETWGETALF